MYQMVDEGDLMLEGEEDKGKDDNKEDKDNGKKGDVKKEGGASQESTKDTADAGQSANNSKRETRTGRLLVRGGLWEVQVFVWPGSHYSDQSSCFSWRKGLVWNTPCYKAPKV